MANNIVLNAGSGGSTLATEQNGASEQYQKIKITDGTAAAFTNMAAVTAGSALKVDASGAAVPITDNSGSLTVDFNAASALPAGTNVIGHVILDSGSTTVVSGTTTISGAVTEATLDAALIAQEATTSGVKGVTAFGAVTTAKPTYTTAKSDALSLDTSGLLRVSLADTPVNTTSLAVNATLQAGSAVVGHVIADSGSTTAVTGTVTVAGAVTEATLDAALIAQEATTSGIKGVTAFGAVTTAKPTYTTAKSDALSLDTSGLLRVSLADTPVNGTALAVNATLQAGSAVVGHVIADSGSTTAVTGTVTVSGAVTEATLDAALIAQEATTSGIKGITAFGAVTTAKPTYTTAKSDALSLDTSGLLRVSLADTPANGTKLLVTPDSVALPANQSVNVAQVNGGTTVTAATGVQKVGIVGNTGATVDAALGTQGTNGVSVMPAAATSGGCSFTSIVGANTNNKTQLKATAGQIYKIEVYSIDSAPQYVKVFNKTSANVTAGTTACDWQIMVPANATAANGAGVTSSYELGVAMGTAMTIMVTAAIGTTDNTSIPANKSIINVFWI